MLIRPGAVSRQQRSDLERKFGFVSGAVLWENRNAFLPDEPRAAIVARLDSDFIHVVALKCGDPQA